LLLLGQVLRVQELVVGAVQRHDELVQLDLDRLGLAFCVCWMRNTIRKVTIVVRVLMVSCQASLRRRSAR